MTETASLWLEPGRVPRFEPLSGPARADAVVLGAGITGLCTALALQSEGMSVIVVEQQWVGAGATGLTTAKLSSLQGTRYSRLRSHRGEEAAFAYATANEHGLAEIRRLADQHAIECDLRERPNYVYAEDEKDRSSLENELEAAREAGLPVEWVEDVPLPFETNGGLRLDGQAEFHPVKFLDGLADAFTAAGGVIHEQTRAVGYSGSGKGKCRVETDRGALSTGLIVLASHFPFADRGLLFARMHPERSYSLAVQIDGDPPPGMFINAGSPVRSIRSHPHGGTELLLVGGEGHKVGQGGSTEKRYETLRGFAAKHFAMRSVDFQWSTQDNVTIDGAPYVGRLPGARGVLVATGYGKWGLAMAPAAAEALAALAAGRESPVSEYFDPRRLPAPRSMLEMAREGSDFSLRFAGDRIVRGVGADADELGPGEGAIVRAGRRQLAVSRADDGTLSVLSARCPHLGCIVSWNDAERSWDCPCHGSRFAADGRLLQGPAVDDLATEEL